MPSSPRATGSLPVTSSTPWARVVKTTQWRGGEAGEPEQLASCYRRSLEIAHAQGFASIAFPSISTGIFGYPIEQAADVAVATVREALAAGSSVTEVTFVCFSDADLAVYQAVLGA